MDLQAPLSSILSDRQIIALPPGFSVLYAGAESYVIGGIGSWEIWSSAQAVQGAPSDPHVAPCNPVGTTCIRSFPQNTYILTFKAVAFSVAAIPLHS